MVFNSKYPRTHEFQPLVKRCRVSFLEISDSYPTNNMTNFGNPEFFQMYFLLNMGDFPTIVMLVFRVQLSIPMG